MIVNYGSITAKRKKLKELNTEVNETHLEWSNLELHNKHCFDLDVEEERLEHEKQCEELKDNLDKLDESIYLIEREIVSEGYKMYL